MFCGLHRKGLQAPQPISPQTRSVAWTLARHDSILGINQESYDLINYPQGSFSDRPGPQLIRHRGSLGRAFALGSLIVRNPIRLPFALTLFPRCTGTTFSFFRERFFGCYDSSPHIAMLLYGDVVNRKRVLSDLGEGTFGHP